ncbi:M48 family metallopeptidase [bacterium]|nr:M48 family metallopeptidase [bacterium]
MRRLFSDEQKSNRRKTVGLVLFLLVLLGGIGAAFGFFFLEDLVVGLLVGVGWGLLSWGGSSLWGMPAVLAAARARHPRPEENRRVRPLVSALMLAVGRGEDIEIRVVDDGAPNAFAVSKGEKAAIVVTTGLLEQLDRYELEGVLAHELAHIENGDSALMVLVSALVGTILSLSEVMWRSMRYGGSRRRRGEGGAAILVLMLLVAIIAPLAAQLVRFAVSRKREFLADATAVAITRNPEGLWSALEKISTDTEPLEVAKMGNAHLWIWNPLREYQEGFLGLFETHPPMEKRIERLRSM